MLPTPQESSDLLGFTGQCARTLLEEGEIQVANRPGVTGGSGFSNVQDARGRGSKERRAALDRMVEITEQSGMYERTERPIKTR